MFGGGRRYFAVFFFMHLRVIWLALPQLRRFVGEPEKAPRRRSRLCVLREEKLTSAGPTFILIRGT